MADAVSHIKNLADFLEQLTKLIGLIALPYVILMGVSFKSGTKLGKRIGQNRRAKKGLPMLTSIFEETKPALFWKDETLIRGGLNGINGIAILSTYVVVMLLFFRPSPDHLPNAVATLLTYPNSMAALYVFIFAVATWRDGGLRVWFLAGFSVVLAVVTWRLLAARVPSFLWIQILIFLLQSLISSHLAGVISGMGSVNFEKIFPAIDLVMVDGQSFRNLRLLNAEANACHFMDSDGLEWLVPHSQIRFVRATARPTE